MSNLKLKLGKKIQRVRKSKNITQEQLAEKINMDITSLSKIETGRNYPQPETLEKISEALDVDINNLFIFSENFSSEEYFSAICKNLNLIKDNNEKLKFIYDILSLLV